MICPNDPEVKPRLIELLNVNVGFFRREAFKAVAGIANPDPELVEHLCAVSDLDINACECVGQLGQTQPVLTDEQLLLDLESFDSTIRERAGIVMAWRQNEHGGRIATTTLERLYSMTDDPRPWVRQAARRADICIRNRAEQLAEKLNL